jgi:DNA polymerase I-like protein with 3'-5' exonuclease and polymerase domains
MLDRALIPTPPISYCVTREEAEIGFAEVARAADGRPIGLDIETAPSKAEAARLAQLLVSEAEIKGRVKAAKKFKSPASELDALKAEAKIVAAQIKYAKAAPLDPNRGRIRLVQLYGGGNRVLVIDVFRTGEEVLQLLNGVDVVAHHAAFEISWLEHAGVDLGEVHCTLQGARLTLGENSRSLAEAAREYLGIELSKTEQLSDWSAHLTQGQLEYAALDAVMAFQLASRILPALAAQSSAYEIQIACIPAVARMMRRGVRLDLEAHAAFIQAKREQRIETCAAYRAACLEIGKPQLADKVPTTPSEKEEALVALLTSEELATWKRTAKSGALSTARNELKRAAFRYPPIKALVELSKIDKMLTSFGPTLTAMVSPVTGRIHASYAVAGTASGRASCASPNMQQAPRKAFRALWRAAAGHKMVGGDFNAMELRAVAHIADDRAMNEAFLAGKDLHKITAARMTGKPESEIADDSEERQAAKAVNFGSIYGIGAAALVKTAWDQYDVVLTLQEAKQWLDAAHQAYPDVTRWRRRHYDKVQADGKIVIGKDAKRGIGRFYPLTRLPKGAKNGYTRSCNLPVQGSCADASMLALEAIDRMLFEEGIEGGPILWLHDEIICEVPEADASHARELLTKAMVEAFAEPFRARR